MGVTTDFPITENNVYTIIAMHPSLIGKSALDSAFGTGEKVSKKVQSHIDTLIRKGKIEAKNGKGYTAKKPWADVAYARVEKVEESAPAVLTIESLPHDAPVQVSLSRSQSNKNNLKEGERILIHLTRKEPTVLQATVLQKLDKTETPLLAGYFSDRSGPAAFVPYNKSIKTRFNIVSGSNPGFVNRDPCSAQMPDDFDTRAPEIVICADQSCDMETGEKIRTVLARKHNIDSLYSQAALEETDRLKRKHINRKKRTDLTKLDLITVDPPESKDLDDAFFVEHIEEGFRVIIAIADVPSLIPAGGAVDREALKRGTTYYFPDKTYHMLPEALSTKKVSLLPNAERPVIYVEQIYDWNGLLKNSRIGAGVMKSKGKLSYGQYYDLLETQDPRTRAVRNWHDTQINAIRVNRNNHPAERAFFEDPAYFVSRSIVETFAVRANASIAAFLSQRDETFLYRINGPAANPALYNRTRKYLKDLGHTLPKNPMHCTWETLDKIIKQARSNGGPCPVRELLKRNLIDRACYSTTNTGHFSLRLPFYTHATSPIRRYPDIINLRILHPHLGFPEFGLPDDMAQNLNTITDELNEKQLITTDVNLATSKYHILHALSRLEDHSIRANLVDVNSSSIQISLPNQGGLRKRIQADELPKDICYLDSNMHELVFINEQGQEVERLSKGGHIKGTLANIRASDASWDYKIEPSKQKKPLESVPLPVRNIG